MQEHSYALVLLDLMLPGITGEAVLEEIRKKGNLPVIVLTAKDSLDEKVKVLTSGADDYITKPFEIREVLARIQVQLRHTEEKEIKESNLSFREMRMMFAGGMHFVNYRSSPFQIIWCSLSLFLLMIYVSIKRLEASILAKVCLNM